MSPPMFGGEGFQWIVSEGTATPFANLDAKGVVIPSITSLMSGVIGIQLFYSTSTPAYDAMMAAYRSGTTNYGSLVDITTVASASADSIGPVATCAWDSVKLVGDALHQLIEVEHLDPRNISVRPRLFEDLTKISFDGASGELILSEIGIRTTGFSSVQNGSMCAWKRGGEGGLEASWRFCTSDPLLLYDDGMRLTLSFVLASLSSL